MKSFDDMEYHPTSEKLVEIIQSHARNNNPQFFRIHVAYYLAVMASMMRCQIKTMDRGVLPVNMYAVNLAVTGAGKGRSTNIMEEQVMSLFLKRFIDETFPAIADANIPKLALERAHRKNGDPDVELLRTQKEFECTGPLLVTFDSGTTAAVRQQRHKLLMANCGSLNLQMDEMAVNLLGNIELLNTYIELFDVGKKKPNLLKNTSENQRQEEIPGRTPTNLMLFGTPTALLNGDKEEHAFFSMLDMGYARRCFFSYTRSHTRNAGQTAREVLDQRLDASSHQFVEQLADQFEDLAGIQHVGKELVISEGVTLLFIEYQLACESLADSLPEHENIRKAEITHRHFKALKLAGAYAFADGFPEITEQHAYYAIKLTEESGKALESLLTRDRPYVKLAKYLSSIGKDVTQADLVEDLPFYKGSVSQKQEMLQLATAYGYKNNILVKKSFNDGIEFIRGETLAHTNLEKLRISHSSDIADGYLDELAPWDQLHMLTQLLGHHWTNHHLKAGHRSEDNVIPGFNLVILDVDGSVPMSTAQTLLKDYKALFYTTKRHTDESNRYRIILPTNFELKLDSKEYKEFMNNIVEWVPFEVDTQANQRARKWASHPMHYEYQDGELLDVLPFIPKTSKNEERKKLMNDQASLDNLERWVMNNTGDGNRNNMVLKYAMILVDTGFDFDQVRQKVMSMNGKLPDKLDEAEILSTIMSTVAKAIAKR